MLKIVNCKTGVGVLSALALSTVGVCIGSTLAFGDMQDADGSSQTCGSSVGINYAPLSSNVCQSSNSTTYRLSRWVYYAVDTSNLPTDSNGKKYIPPIGIANSGNGVTGGLEGWLIVEPGMSDCIVENGGFWRRGYFQNKTNIYQERTYNGSTFGATQNGVAPIGFTGRSSDNIQNSNQVGKNSSAHTIGEFLGGWDGSLGQQTLYNGNQTNVWARMDTTKGAIGDSAALALYQSFNSTTDNFDYGDYFMSTADGQDAGDATVLFCYSDGTPYNGQVQIGSSNSVYAYHSKKNGEDAKKGLVGGSGDATNNTINLGEVNSEDYTPGHVFMKIEKAKEKSGKTKYEATMSLNGAIKYSFDGSNWASSDKANEKEASATVSTSLSPSFTLAEGDNTICINLDYKEKPGDSGYQKLKACAKVKYSPSVAEVDSDTVAVVNNSVYSSHADGSADAIKKYDISVDAGPGNTIEWAHYLGYRNLSGDAPEGVWSKTYNIYGGGALDHKLEISPYTAPSTSEKKGYSWAWYINDDVNGRYPSASSSHTPNISSNVGAFPGETYTESQYLKHPNKVNAGKAAKPVTGYTEETSGVEVNLKAKDIECVYDENTKFQIGVDNPNDYRWLSIFNSQSGITKTVGDGLEASDVFWLEPSDDVKVTQVACFGSQIAKDAEDKSEDRFNNNLWSDRNDHTKNMLFTLSSNLPAGLFTGAEGASKTGMQGSPGSHDNASLAASEIGISDYSQESKPSSRISNGYKIVAESNTLPINNVGRSLVTSFSKPNGVSVSITTKVPYNYYMDLSLVGSGDLLTGENTSFTATIEPKGRVNKQVCKGKPDCGEYATETRKTTAGILVFTMDSSLTADELKANSSFSYEGNIFEGENIVDIEGRIRDAVNARMPGYEPTVVNSDHLMDVKEIVFGKGQSQKITADGIDMSSLSVGTKVCAAAAVFPSDSHNTGNGSDIDDPDQFAAFDDSAATKTGIRVSCRTIGKSQTMSVEGNGMVTNKTVSASKTTYGGRIFTSWSEYQIIAQRSNASSGAVTAYALNNMTPKTVNMDAFPNDSSVESNRFLYPQTFGSFKPGNTKGKAIDPGSDYEAEMNWSYAETLKKNILDTYGTREGSCNSGNISKAENKNYLLCVGGGELRSDSIPGAAKDKDTLVIRSEGDIVITENSGLNNLDNYGNPKRLIIIAKNISIDNNVGLVNAWLIVDGGELNTCADHELNQDGDFGNQLLFNECNNPLEINGPVIVSGTLTLIRTFGGGSMPDGTKAPKTLVQRAEIFNYDPAIVEWAYKESQKNPHLETTYTETLAPRL